MRFGPIAGAAPNNGIGAQAIDHRTDSPVPAEIQFVFGSDTSTGAPGRLRSLAQAALKGRILLCGGGVKASLRTFRPDCKDCVIDARLERVNGGTWNRLLP
jgi:hypothetical protein